MAELDQCKKERPNAMMPEGMMPFVVYGYPMMGNMNMNMNNMNMNMNMPSYGMMDERCNMYGHMNQCFPQMNVMNPLFFNPYQQQRPGCGCGVSDLDD